MNGEKTKLKWYYKEVWNGEEKTVGGCDSEKRANELMKARRSRGFIIIGKAWSEKVTYIGI